MGSRNYDCSNTLNLFLLLFTIRKTHVPVKAHHINEHILYEELNKYLLASCTHFKNITMDSLKNKNSDQQWVQRLYFRRLK